MYALLPIGAIRPAHLIVFYLITQMIFGEGTDALQKTLKQPTAGRKTSTGRVAWALAAVLMEGPKISYGLTAILMEDWKISRALSAVLMEDWKISWTLAAMLVENWKISPDISSNIHRKLENILGIISSAHGRLENILGISSNTHGRVKRQVFVQSLHLAHMLHTQDTNPNNTLLKEKVQIWANSPGH